MNDIREFVLKNANGENWNLNDENSFFSGINGLGQERKVSYQQIGNQFIKLEDLLKQKSISGKIIFEDYDDYYNFSKFIMFKPLTLSYTSAGTYEIQVSIDKLGKTEITEKGLESDVDFKGLTTFYKMVIAEKMNIDTGKRYPYRYPYQYAKTITGEVVIQSDSKEVSPARIVILGPCSNPEYRHYVNGVLKTTGKINCTISEGNRLIIDSTNIPFRILEADSNNCEISDKYQDSDFTTNRFLFLQYGENRISFSHQGDNALRLMVEGRIEYESV